MSNITSLQINQKQIQISSFFLGQTIKSTLPINSPRLHLKDGSVLSSTNYSDFIEYIKTNKANMSDCFLEGEDSVPFEQPILSSNGTLGSDTFAVSQTAYVTDAGGGQAYTCFDNNSNTFWYAWPYPYELTMYNPQPICITNMQITNGHYTRLPYKGKVFASDDNKNWTELTTWTNPNEDTYGVWNIDLSDNTKAYSYYKLSITQDNANGNGAQIYNINLTATVGVSALDKYNKILNKNGYCEKYIYDSESNTVKLPTSDNKSAYEYVVIK